MEIQVVIPAYKPGESLTQLLDRLSSQTVKPDSVYVVNTEKKYWPEGLEDHFSPLKLTHIAREEFDHGGTRRAAAAASSADVLVFMTQDAVPADQYLIEKLTEPFRKDPAVGVVFGRQLARQESGLVEKMYREYNYPEKSYFREKKDLKKYGIKAFFCSNVCAAYRMAAYQMAGGFPEHAIFNEDMVLCSRILEKGFKVCYMSQAKVYHSHDYTWSMQFHRSFDLGVSHAQFPDVFGNVSSESEGIRMVLQNTGKLLKKRELRAAGGLWISSAARYVGYRLGKLHFRLPASWLPGLTMNPDYWNKAKPAGASTD